MRNLTVCEMNSVAGGLDVMNFTTLGGDFGSAIGLMSGFSYGLNGAFAPGAVISDVYLNTIFYSFVGWGCGSLVGMVIVGGLAYVADSSMRLTNAIQKEL